MPGVRRVFRDVTKKVSGVLTGARDDSPEVTAPPPDPGPPPAHPAEPQEDSSVTVASPSLPSVDVPTADAPAADVPGAGEPDACCVAAVDQARAAAVEVAASAVGDHLGVEVELTSAELGFLVTHSFATTDPAYVGWRWAVSVARADGSDTVTVDEVVLLPGSEALLAPAWLPWSERVQPGDLGPGDLLPPAADDPRLVPSYADVDVEPLLFELHRELGLGRPRVLSLDGRADAAERWYDGAAGPDAPIAKGAPADCASCGFFVPMAGALGRVFGACANGMAPDDGRVVALTHGCGAHSETVVEQVESTYAGMAVEDEELEIVANSTGPETGDAPAELAGGLADDAPATGAGDATDDATATTDGAAPAELAGGLADDEG